MRFVILCIIVSAVSAESIYIASWNIRDTGPSLFEQRKEVVPILIQQFQRWDLLAWQEIVDKANTVVGKITDMLNEEENDFYTILSPRVGRPPARIEQYGFLYRRSKFDLLRCGTYPNLNQIIYRSPFICHFRQRQSNITFTAISLHTKPISGGETAKEISELVNVYLWAVQTYNEPNSILLGDWNADCDYLPPKLWPDIPLRQDSRFKWYITDDMDTTPAMRFCSYDRIVVAGSQLQDRIRNGHPVYIDKEFKPLPVEMKKISDHYPVQIEMVISDNTWPYAFLIIASLLLIYMIYKRCYMAKIDDGMRMTLLR